MTKIVTVHENEKALERCVTVTEDQVRTKEVHNISQLFLCGAIIRKYEKNGERGRAKKPINKTVKKGVIKMQMRQTRNN